MSLSFSSDKIEIEGMQLHGAVTELGNAVIALFWEGEEPRLGTLTVTLPNKISSALLGDRNSVLGQLIGEQLATGYGKMVLVSTNLSALTERTAARAIIELAKRISSGRTGKPGEDAP